METKKITIKDVARQSGVSISTVSQILNGNEARFSALTVKKVIQAKKDLNYEPDYFARRMIMKKSKTIGVLVPDITNPFFSELVRGIENIFYQKGFITMLCNADLDQEKEDAYLAELSRRGVDGFIIASSVISNESINATLKAKNHPFIVLDQKKADGISDAVLTDDFSGGSQAAQHLKDLGHQKIAIVMPTNAPENVCGRLAGVRSVYEEKQIEIIDAQLSKIGGREAVAKILATDVTGIFAVNDEIALGIYLGLAEAGKQIPEDYSVIGYDNIDMCEYMVPKLTTIAQPIFELGQTTANMLLERIETPDKNWEEKTLPVHLVKRFSTAHLI
ncbi:ribose utilization transcriptional repressor RbsR [Pediococcus pentosaceus]|uniref:ribose utilization transcriptional repressor RbsR n=1 Tax=Pediococcus pentosaceus TaxID=1255 RepID=UPI003F85510B